MEHKAKSSCCGTASVINCFTRCLCLRLPNYNRFPEAKRRKIEEDAANEIYAANRLYATQKQRSNLKTALQANSTPRIPLGQRVLAAKLGTTISREKKTSDETSVRPITQLVGISRNKARRHRSVTRWAEKLKERGAYREGKAEKLVNACRLKRVSFISFVAKGGDETDLSFQEKTPISELMDG